jgi:hypothetical protein
MTPRADRRRGADLVEPLGVSSLVAAASVSGLQDQPERSLRNPASAQPQLHWSARAGLPTGVRRGSRPYCSVVEIARDVRDAIAQVLGGREAFSDRTAHDELRGRLLAFLLITFILDVLGTILMIWIGNHSFRRSAVWSTSLLLTGGAALDTGGQRHYWLALAFELWAVTAVGAIAGSFGAFFHRLYLERDRSTAPAKNR